MTDADGQPDRRAQAARTTAAPDQTPDPRHDVARTAATTPVGRAGEGPEGGAQLALHAASLAERLRAHGLAQEGAAERFEIRRMLGAGAGGAVFSVHDRSLDREVAVKVLPQPAAAAGAGAVEQFVAEARIASALQHPGILPIYDAEVTQRGQPYFVMKQIDGITLGAAIERSAEGARATEIATTNAVVTIAIHLAQALAYAHIRGVIHQDVKPDNVMLGGYGEVVLVDWGVAVRGERVRDVVYGTPLYMSPEQARKEHADRRSDVYCLGATILHALTLRVPTWRDEPEEFWRRKRQGLLDPFSDAERRAIPGPLRAILLKALAADPAARYQDADSLLDDLRHYQAGLAISAYRDSPLERLARWHRANWRPLWAGAAALAVVGALLGALYGERLQELATWGRPLVAERFADDGWRERWVETAGSFAARDGGIVSTSDQSSVLMLKQRLQGDAAIEFDARILPGTPPCDLSVEYARDIVPGERGGAKLVSPYEIKFGAFDGIATAILGPSGTLLASSADRPEVGRLYHVRVEVVHDRLTLAVDGRVIASYRDPFPLVGGHLGIFAYYQGKWFGQVKVYQLNPPQKLRATAIGDAFAEQRQYDQAARQFQQVAEAHPGTAMAAEAAFKRGLCLELDGRPEQADAAWAGLGDSPYARRVELQVMERLSAAGKDDELLDRLLALAPRASSEDLQEVALRWSRWVAHAINAERVSWDVVARHVEVHDRVLAGQRAADHAAADALVNLGRAEEAMATYPDEQLIVPFALHCLVRHDEILARFPNRRNDCVNALFAMGRLDEIERGYQESPWGVGGALLAQGEAGLALARYPREPGISALALVMLGRFDEAIALEPDRQAARAAKEFLGRSEELAAPGAGKEARIFGLMALGRSAEVLAAYGENAWHRGWIHHHIGLRLAMAGDLAAAEPHFAVPTGLEGIQSHWHYDHYVIPPFLHWLAGDRQAMARACEDVLARRHYAFMQRPWHAAMYLLGRIDEAAFRAQPHRAYIDADFALIDGMRRELAGDAAGALAAYRRYLALPGYRRGPDIDRVQDEFAAWRERTLSASP